MSKTKVTKTELIAICEQNLPSQSFFTFGMKVTDIKRLPTGYLVEIQVPDNAAMLKVLQGQHFSEWVTDNFEITDA